MNVKSEIEFFIFLLHAHCSGHTKAKFWGRSIRPVGETTRYICGLTNVGGNNSSLISEILEATMAESLRILTVFLHIGHTARLENK